MASNRIMANEQILINIESNHGSRNQFWASTLRRGQAEDGSKPTYCIKIQFVLHFSIFY